MATLLHLAQQSQLFKLDAALGWREQEERRIYVFPRVREWMERELPHAASDWDLETSPIEQLDAFLATFCAGATLTFERQFRPLRHISKGIWELKTADLRMFGWFQAQDCFVCTACDTTSRVKTHSLYDGYRDQAVRLRDQLDLDEPKFLAGSDPNVVVSAFCYPPPPSGSPVC